MGNLLRRITLTVTAIIMLLLPGCTRQVTGSPEADNRSNQITPVQSPATTTINSHLATDRMQAPRPFHWPMLVDGSEGAAVRRLQQLLAELGYLPMTFQTAMHAQLGWKGQLEMINHPPVGHWSLKYKNTPDQLQKLWKVGHYGLITKGAVMSFEARHGLKTDGISGPKVLWNLVSDSIHQRQNTQGYTFIEVSMKQPEHLALWYDGRVVVRSLANTGISQSPTAIGTWPIYLQYRSQTMTGTTPSGQHYRDPGVPYVSYFYQGEAIHGFKRQAYGYPQSLGCVELPVDKASLVWKYVHYGTLVTVAP
jgi:peptidoglycan hydrolase-like protein with peptidoglycan-binding domain